MDRVVENHEWRNEPVGEIAPEAFTEERLFPEEVDLSAELEMYKSRVQQLEKKIEFYDELIGKIIFGASNNLMVAKELPSQD